MGGNNGEAPVRRWRRTLWQALLEIDIRGILGSIAPRVSSWRARVIKWLPIDGIAALSAAIPGAEFNTLAPGRTG